MESPIKCQKTLKNNENHLSKDILCGFCWYPEILQKCAVLPCFIFSYCLGVTFTQSLVVYLTSQVTAIEKQFGLSSTQTGFLLSSNDIGFVAAVLFTSHFLAKGNIPLHLGVCTFMFGVFGMICSLPHLIHGGGNGDLDSSQASSETSENMKCHVDRNVSVSDTTHCNSNNRERDKYMAFIIIAIGMMFQGIFKSPRSALSTIYVDSNVLDKARTGCLLGIILAAAVIGPALAAGLGSLVSSVYVTLEDVPIETKDPRWIGAWWVGFLVFGACAMMVSIPLACFPTKLPRKQRLADREDILQDINKSTTDVQTNPDKLYSEENERKLRNNGMIHQIKDFFRIMRTLIMNPVFDLIILSHVMKTLAVAGPYFYGPKYLEIQFFETAWRANLIFGGSRLGDLVIGSLLGGYLTTRFKLTRTGNLKVVLVASIIGCITTGIAMTFSCDQPSIQDFHRIRNPNSTKYLRKQSVGDACGFDCKCSQSQFLPICSETGETFYSPCHAGCKNGSVESYSECLCISGNGTATPGFCDTGCIQIIPYSIIGFVVAFCYSIQLMPVFMAVLRSASESEQPAAIGIYSLLNTLLGLLPGPIIFGILFDQTCLLWSETCGQRESCALYNMDELRVSYHSLSLSLNLFALILLVMGIIIALRSERKSVRLSQPTTGVELDTKY